ncbi:prepilin peptidase [Sinisalibacter aestuarii]|uniref:Prepilin type IV endopeptidase peptidase domain-containing protein n=1 Tax=Sinisalibacter aestuarii TaxID=2949426 RepID=A0ABQ5LUG9_9RHOB|nr:prepilin peptidase [Sinisalibacter aestuarii]GKY88621.1 hypothetical protein STA1M1_24900 [Sinisalibacter aestuarii]
MSPDMLPLVLAAPLLVAMAVSDVRHMRIPNALVLAMLALFVVTAPFALAPAEIALRLGVGALVFALGLAGFVAGMLAGGDVKGLAALMLFVPTGALAPFAFTFSAAMLAGIALTLGLRRAIGSPGSRYVSLAVDKGYPMGLSIALAGLLLPLTAGL